MTAEQHFEKLMKSLITHCRDNQIGSEAIKNVGVSLTVSLYDGGKMNYKSVLTEDEVRHIPIFTQEA